VTATAGQAPSDLYTRPAELLQRLIRFDTTNPPGNERECVAFIDGLLREAGFETTVLAREPERPNLVARLAGRGAAPPLLLYGHVDVVTTAGQRWSHPPFEGVERDGFVWGRGAVDMKGGVAMMLSALLRARAEGLEPAGDVIFCALADEENMSGYGAEWLVRDHPERFAGVRHAIGEFGGFTLHFSGRRFYPIQVAEKQICWLKATIRGSGGHGAMINRGGTMARLARFLRDLDRRRLPVHVTPVAREMLERMAAALPQPRRGVLLSLLKPRLTDRVLPLLGEAVRTTEPLLRNTVSPTIVRAGEKINVVPAQIEVELDGRALPGFGPDDLIGELQELVGTDVELELVRHDPGPREPDLELFEMLAGILRELDPGTTPVPLLQIGVTDARFFSRLGIQTYGFLPMRLPADLNFLALVHAADERVPAAAIDFGVEAISRALQRV
jgi:acetylornithine deacetylase/succinyl-diaminopimelate desuccinylase-like protein